MTTVSARISELEQTVKDVQSELTKLKNLPAEPPVGSVVKFTKRLGIVAQKYTYAAIHTDAGWFMTGRDNRRMDWSELLAAMNQNETYSVSTEWEVRSSPNGSAIPASKIQFNPSAVRSWYVSDMNSDDVW